MKFPFLLQARYTGPGPLSGAWLNAVDHGFMTQDQFETLELVRAEAERLRQLDRRLLEGKDWELRALDRRPDDPACEPEPVRPERETVPPSIKITPPRRKRTRRK